MISIKGLFTQEANEEVEALLKAPSTLLSAGGGASRVVGKEAILSLYMLTK